MKNFTMKELWLLLCCLMAVSAIHAQNYSKKVKNAKGIEVTYQSSYKGKVRPGYLLMTVQPIESLWKINGLRANSQMTTKYVLKTRHLLPVAI